MKYINITKKIVAVGLLIMVFSACKKDTSTVNPLGEIAKSSDGGPTWITIIGGGSVAAPGIVSSPIAFVNTPTTITVADVRRNAANATELGKTMHIVIKDDTTAVHTANSAYKLLPSAWYTIASNTPQTGGSGGSYALTMNSGDFAMPIVITIPNATLLDPSTLYGLGFTITTVDAGGSISSVNTVVAEIGAKNIYDGVYSLQTYQTGWAAYGISDGLSNKYPDNISFITTGAGSCKLFNNYTGTYLIAGFAFPISATQFGATTPVYTFDLATNKLVSVVNSTPDDGRARTLNLDPAVTTSRYDPTTKSIYAAYYMTQTGRPNQYFRDTLTYVKSR